MAPGDPASRPITGIIDRLEDSTDQDPVTLRHLIEAFGKASFLTSLCVPALLVISPLSGVPLFSSACGVLIAAIAVQMFIGRDHLWLPDFVMRLSVKSDKVTKALKRLHGVGTKIDDHTRPRLSALMTRPFRKFYQALCVLCGALMPFLEIVPFSSSILGAATILFATALIVRDGLLACIGMVLLLFAASLPLFALQAI